MKKGLFRDCFPVLSIKRRVYAKDKGTIKQSQDVFWPKYTVKKLIRLLLFVWLCGNPWETLKVTKW